MFHALIRDKMSQYLQLTLKWFIKDYKGEGGREGKSSERLRKTEDRGSEKDEEIKLVKNEKLMHIGKEHFFKSPHPSIYL